MKKNKTSIAALSLIGSLTLGVLASCNSSRIPSLKEEDGVILNYGDNKITIDDVFGSYTNDNIATSAKAYYTAVSDIFTQIAVETTTVLQNDVDDKVESFYKTAKDNATTNGTSNKEEIEKAFANEGVKNEEQLRQKYMVDAKKSQNTKNFETDNHILTYRSDYINEKSPYVTRHILVKVDASGTNIYNGKISEANAYKIANVVKGLSSSESFRSFGEVAERFSDDGSSANYGLLTDPMDITTSFVNEFKLGLYAQDYLFNSNVNDNGYTKDRTNLIDRTEIVTENNPLANELTVESVLGNKGVKLTDDSTNDKLSAFGIPLSAVLDLEKYAEKTKSDKTNSSVDNASEDNYPRNILFNHYFNNHGISYIYLDKNAAEYKNTYGFTVDESRFGTFTNINLVEYSDKTQGAVTSTAIKSVGSDKKILTDGNGKPILVTRAGTGSTSSDSSDGSDSSSSGYEGIHFITTDFDPFESVDTKVDTPTVDKKYDYSKLFENITDNAEKVQVVRNDFFNLTIPSLSSTDTTVYNPSLITSVTATESKNYNTLADAVRTALKGTYGTTLEYKQYEINKKAAEDKGAKLNEEIDKLIQEYITTQINEYNYSNSKTLRDAWESYLNQVSLQKEFSTRILPSSCINEFLNADVDGIDKGSVCYVKNQ